MTRSIVLLLLLSFQLKTHAQWVKIPSGTKGELDAIHFMDSLKGLCSGAFVNTLMTTDGGETWYPTIYQGFRDFSFVDSLEGYGISVVGQSMGKTTDGSIHWTSLNPPTANSLWAVFAESSTSVYFAGTGGVLWKTLTGGQSFSTLNSGTTDLITDIFFTHSYKGYLAVRSGEIKSKDIGTGWITSFLTPGIELTEMDFPSQSIGYVAGSEGTVVKTSNAGSSWTILQTNSTAYLHGIHFYDDLHGIAVGTQGTILYTANGGQTWTPQFTGTKQTLYDVRMLGTNTAVVVGDKGMILKGHVSALSVDNPSDYNPIHLYPNPVKDQLYFRTDITIHSVRITDITGKVHLSLNEPITQIDFTNFNPGVYLVQIQTERGEQTFKIEK